MRAKIHAIEDLQLFQLTFFACRRGIQSVLLPYFLSSSLISQKHADPYMWV